MADKPLTSVAQADSVSDSDKIPINQGGAVRQIAVDKLRNIDAELKNSGAAADAKVTGEKLDNISDALSGKIVCASSGSEIVLTDSDDRKIEAFKVYGRSTQVKTTGKNLLPYPYRDKTKSVAGVTFNDNGDGGISVTGTPAGLSAFGIYYGSANLSAGKYITSLSGNFNNITLQIGITYSDGTQSFAQQTSSNECTFDIHSPSDNLDISIKRSSNGVSMSGVVYPMLRLASITDPTWEPYTGGVASPSPDWPQKIESVENPVVKVSGKNLLVYPYYIGSPYKSSGVTITYDDTQTISISGTFTNNEYKVLNNVVIGNVVKESGKYILSSDLKDVILGLTIRNSSNSDVVRTVVGTGSVMLDVPQSAVGNYFYVFLQGAQGQSVNTSGHVMLEKGSTTTSYEPYRAPQSLTLPQTLRGIPVDSGETYTDENGQKWLSDVLTVYKDGSGVIERKCEYIKAASWDGWYVHQTNNNFYVDYRNISGKYLLPATNAFCNFAKFAIDREHTDGNRFTIGGTGIYFSNTNTFADLAALKAFINNNDVFFLVPLNSNSYYTETLSADQVKAILAMQTYKPTTIITNDQDAQMEVSYVADTKLYIDNKFNQLSEALLSK